MLSNARKRLRNEQRCAELRERLYLLPSPAIAKRHAEARLLTQEGDRKAREREGHREARRFERIGRYLDGEAREAAEERYVTAVWGIRTSWKAVERAAIYFVFRSKNSLRTRRFASQRPAWTSGVVQIDKHHMATRALPIRPPLQRAA